MGTQGLASADLALSAADGTVARRESESSAAPNWRVEAVARAHISQ